MIVELYLGLDCETSGVGAKKTVEKLKCKVCIQYQSNIEGRRNYSDNGFQVLTPFELAISGIIHVLISMYMQCHYLEKVRLRLDVLMQVLMLRSQKYFTKCQKVTGKRLLTELYNL